MNKILAPAVGLLGTYAFIKYNNFKQFQKEASVFIEALNMVPGSFKESNFKNVKFLLALQLKNPTKFEINIDSIELELSINEKKIAEIYTMDVLKIKPESIAKFKNEISLDLRKLPVSILQALQASIASGQLNASVSGCIKSFWGKMNFTQNEVFEI